jgi:hypothetical protein
VAILETALMVGVTTSAGQRRSDVEIRNCRSLVFDLAGLAVT